MKKMMILTIAIFAFSLFAGFSAFAQSSGLEPYSQGGTDFTSCQAPIYFQYDNPRYSPCYPGVTSPEADLQPYAPIQPMDNPNLTASTSNTSSQLQPYAPAD